MTSEDLPYPPVVQRLLEPARRGFRWLNTYVTAPMIRIGAGPLMSTPQAGALCVLRTVGRTSGKIREAPLGYAIVNGRVAMVAGYGREAHWFRNALANPDVEVALPGAVLAGRTEEVTDLEERRLAFRTVMTSLGYIGRATVGDVARLTDTEVDELAHAFPVLAITPTALRPGPYDPDGVFQRATPWIWLGALVATIGATSRLCRRR